MKLARVGSPNEEIPAILDSDGSYRDLTPIIPDINGNTIQNLSWTEDLDIESLSIIPKNTRVGPCVNNVGKMICVGLNYSDHAAETGNPIPTEPILFGKATSSIIGPNDTVRIPRGSTKTDWEVELAIVIGKKASYVEIENSMDHVAGYCIVNDISEREFQLEKGGQWIKGKSCDTFAPMGPWLVTKDEIEDPQELKMWLEVDGTRYQDGSTRTMVFGVKTLVSYISQFMTLYPGDIIPTGTPPGVGLGQKPPQYLKAGQTMRLGIGGLGEQNQRVIQSE